MKKTTKKTGLTNLSWLRAYLFVSTAMFLLLSEKTVSAQSAESDSQSWNDVQISAALSKQVDFNLIGTFRFGGNVQKLVDRRIGVGFTFRTGKYLSFIPSYTNIVTTPVKGRSAVENRLNFAATIRLPIKKFVISDRSLFERRLRLTDSTRYRNRLQIERGFKINNFNFGLFASDEVFYDWSVNHWVRNRFIAGGSKSLNKRLTLDVYYLRQNDGRTRPGDLNVIGTVLRIKY